MVDVKLHTQPPSVEITEALVKEDAEYQRLRRVHILRAIDTLGRLGLDGMTLQTAKIYPRPAAPPPPLSLIRRCACGQPISNSRRRCRACYEQMLIDLGEQIDTQELLDACLMRNPDIALEDLRPHLRLLTEKAIRE